MLCYKKVLHELLYKFQLKVLSKRPRNCGSYYCVTLGWHCKTVDVQKPTLVTVNSVLSVNEIQINV
jgi:hypothetical protein